MADLKLPIYDNAKNQIQNMKENGSDWEQIKGNYQTLKAISVLSEDITEDIWNKLVDAEHEVFKDEENRKKAGPRTVIISNDEDNEATVPTDKRSSWQLYRKKLLGKGLSLKSVNKLEENTIKLLRKLNKDTSETGPKKGLVIGQVQSGKTASMAGLMAMAADWGWNTFIVLSGMIENLREQTQERLISDLNSPGNNDWRSFHKLSRHSQPGERTQNLNFNDNCSQKYLNVCLKNKTRLENLLGWLKDDENKLKQMKILVIDDEADQGSINTKGLDKEERSKINELLIDLVHVSSSGEQPKSMNYISYTATPYSNFLNESHPESLYPKDFIAVLPVADEYFGPKQIFGNEESEDSDHLDIVRIISDADVDLIKELQNGKRYDLPPSFVLSILWFFNAAAVKRYYGDKNPVSMLIHTSQRQIDHSRIAESVGNWIKNINQEELINKCQALYHLEKDRFDISRFREGFPEYPVPDNELRDYPDFIKIKPFILELKRKISHIKMDSEGDLSYHNGIHLCIDNSSMTGITDENTHIRLAYPNSRQLQKLAPAPAFIIIGGSTLSRGLTIEGLVSTYFLRAANAGDSLMQMGRWFGYRKGYELLPRIWMTEKTFSQFQFLTSLEEELRKELIEFDLGNRSPAEYGPRVKNSPQVSWLRVTAANKMQGAQEIEMDFAGASIQTIHFENDPKLLGENIETTQLFLDQHCPAPEKSMVSNSLVYRGVDFQTIRDEFLLKTHFNSRSKVFNQIDAFCEWFEKVKQEIGYQNWNIIVPSAGAITELSPTRDNEWRVKDYTLTMVNRSKKSSSMNYGADIANIGVLRGPHDVFADIKDEHFKGNSTPNKQEMEKIRKSYGLNNVPQLIIYRIRKDSEASRTVKTDKSPNRIDLNFNEDIIGVYINVPGDKDNKPHAKALTVNMKKFENDNE
ncbi:Z1 domain-containing protein [Virgibacillus sp. MG-45]|uniref:Z1 domain-containing protein n=1 Tax=Virgibacillus sp. MG-45 TaxID=3102791 RepID=UPI002ED85BD4